MIETRLGRARSALAANPVFSALGPAHLDTLMAYGTTARYAAGARIFERGDPADSLMLVPGGRVRIGNDIASGREAVLGYLAAGDMLGEVALLDGMPRSTGAAAAEACELLVLRRRELAPRLERQPAVTIRLVELMCERLRRATAMIEELMGLNAGQRMAIALLRLADEHGKQEGQSITIDVRMSQSDLASQVGLCREVVNRQLRAWQRAGIVAVRAGRITIRQPRRLQAGATSAG